MKESQSFAITRSQKAEGRMFKIADPNAVVFVVLSTNGEARSLALPPHEERALIVGSMARAEFRVRGVGVAPIQFHFERYEDAVWLIPAYGSKGLRLNGARVFGPTPLDQRNVILFCDVRIETTIIDADSFEADSDSFATGTFSRTELRSSYTLDLPGDEDTTQFAMPAVPQPDKPDEHPTTVFERVPQGGGDPASQHAEPILPHGYRSIQAEVSSSPDQTTRRIVPFRQATARSGDNSPGFTSNGTQIMAPYRPAASNAPNIAPPVTQIEPSQKLATDTVRLLPPGNATRQETDARQPALEDHVEPRAVDRHQQTSRRDCAVVALDSAPPHAQHAVAVPRTAHRTEANAAAARNGVKPPRLPRAKRISWLTQLGLATKARPFAVAGGLSMGAFFLTLLLLAGTHLIERRPLAVAVQNTRTLIAALNSLRPAVAAPSAVAPPLVTVAPAKLATPAVARAVTPQASVIGPPRRKALY